ncbi:hypothetical protein GW17_00061426 [Ensete ventricosum]|nr:hypothetical protein GW17_00061426 [Ensete ventricosum]RZS16796.1 hypothetical protein BHM03_00048854 [Ensete ventricosum]
MGLHCDFVAVGGDDSCLQVTVVEVVVERVRLVRSLLVVIKLLLVAIKVDGSERLLLAAIKEDGSERSLLAMLCNEISLLIVIKSQLVAIKVDDSVCATRATCLGLFRGYFGGR